MSGCTFRCENAEPRASPTCRNACLSVVCASPPNINPREICLLNIAGNRRRRRQPRRTIEGGVRYLALRDDRRPPNVNQVCPPLESILHLNKTNFLVATNCPACNRQKYTPLAWFDASHVTVCVPGSFSSFTSVATSLPNMSYTLRIVNCE